MELVREPFKPQDTWSKLKYSLVGQKLTPRILPQSTYSMTVQCFDYLSGIDCTPCGAIQNRAKGQNQHGFTIKH
jgi:hypothetical protein